MAKLWIVSWKTKMSKGLRWGGIWQRWGKYFCKEHFLHTAVCHRNTLTMTNAEAPLNRGSKWGFEAGSRSWPLVSRSNTRLLDLCTLLFLAVLYRDAKSSERRERVRAIILHTCANFWAVHKHRLYSCAHFLAVHEHWAKIVQLC